MLHALAALAVTRTVFRTRAIYVIMWTGHMDLIIYLLHQMAVSATQIDRSRIQIYGLG